MTEDEMVGWHHRLDGQEAWSAAVHGVRKSRTRLNGVVVVQCKSL